MFQNSVQISMDAFVRETGTGKEGRSKRKTKPMKLFDHIYLTMIRLFFENTTKVSLCIHGEGPGGTIQLKRLMTAFKKFRHFITQLILMGTCPNKNLWIETNRAQII
ncbi:hypothetical protein CV102_22630 [Natronococcus pandeyae]|uniref:Uncharacterized protein n=1 Tax=Natronococcus pandeyae TaxID=2055836 RepID=A0A8J8PZB6_9EURY|nr:hypothetical protein CV102_22630 [Natronococcus pandeyae]